MASMNETRAFHETNEPYALPNDAQEWERRNAQRHQLLPRSQALLGSIYPEPNRILEIGCGSGAWAIQAAQTYPKSSVIAIDISPLPSRALPPNTQFLQLNVTDTALPFEQESFDIIHARFFFLHLRNWKTILTHIISYLKPRGWLWIEETDIYFRDDGPHGLGPFCKKFNDIYLSYMSSRNVDPLAGSSLSSVLQDTNSFSQVNCISIKCPFNGNDTDPRIQLMGRVWYSSLQRVVKGLDPKLIEACLSPEVMEVVIQEAGDPLRSSYWPFNMTWSQKK
ncbi:hypothetical protein H2248_007803 [Termitomyces sp. 'cryptogamus']|nr:hypothetical protein H2248_007803 [Termitomyces sp. 'cryptogamus']